MVSAIVASVVIVVIAVPWCLLFRCLMESTALKVQEVSSETWLGVALSESAIVSHCLFALCCGDDDEASCKLLSVRSVSYCKPLSFRIVLMTMRPVVSCCPFALCW